jgi:hypothetical protein
VIPEGRPFKRTRPEDTSDRRSIESLRLQVKYRNILPTAALLSPSALEPAALDNKALDSWIQIFIEGGTDSDLKHCADILSKALESQNDIDRTIEIWRNIVSTSKIESYSEQIAANMLSAALELKRDPNGIIAVCEKMAVTRPSALCIGKLPELLTGAFQVKGQLHAALRLWRVYRGTGTEWIDDPCCL